MRPSRVKQLWAASQPAFCTLVHLTDPAVCELVSALGFDCVWLDLEHHATSVETAARMMTAVRAGGSADVMARPGKGEFMRLGRLLEAGAQGILYPRCDSAAEAREVVRWAKFAPLGERGFDGANADNQFGQATAADYVRAANAETWLAVQIESPAALRQTRAIAEVPGVDMIFFGPADFSLLDGRPGDVQGPATLRALEQAARQTRAAGKQFGTLAVDEVHVRRCLDLGATFIAWGSDIAHLRRAFAAQKQTLERLAAERK